MELNTIEQLEVKSIYEKLCLLVHYINLKIQLLHLHRKENIFYPQFCDDLAYKTKRDKVFINIFVFLKHK